MLALSFCAGLADAASYAFFAAKPAGEIVSHPGQYTTIPLRL